MSTERTWARRVARARATDWQKGMNARIAHEDLDRDWPRGTAVRVVGIRRGPKYASSGILLTIERTEGKRERLQLCASWVKP